MRQCQGRSWTENVWSFSRGLGDGYVKINFKLIWKNELIDYDCMMMHSFHWLMMLWHKLFIFAVDLPLVFQSLLCNCSCFFPSLKFCSLPKIVPAIIIHWKLIALKMFSCHVFERSLCFKLPSNLRSRFERHPKSYPQLEEIFITWFLIRRSRKALSSQRYAKSSKCRPSALRLVVCTWSGSLNILAFFLPFIRLVALY